MIIFSFWIFLNTVISHHHINISSIALCLLRSCDSVVYSLSFISWFIFNAMRIVFSLFLQWICVISALFLSLSKHWEGTRWNDTFIHFFTSLNICVHFIPLHLSHNYLVRSTRLSGSVEIYNRYSSVIERNADFNLHYNCVRCADFHDGI